MPASRIAFAITDLMEEIRRLSSADAKIKAELRLPAVSYSLVKSEIGHHYGKPMKTEPMMDHRPSVPVQVGEFFKIGGLRISTAANNDGSGAGSD